ncbi:MAG: type IV pilus secretin PilQ [Thermodesulfobacteriota bacterium]
MEGLFLKGFRRHIFLGALFILLLASPSFSQAPLEKNGTLSIQKIEVTETDKGSRVIIEGSRAFEYSAFKLENPPRVVVDLPQAELGNLGGPIEVQNGIVNVIRSTQVEDPQKVGARVEIGLEQNLEYNLTSEGNLLYVDLARPVVPSTPKTEEKVAAAEQPEKEKVAPPPQPLKGAKLLKQLEISAKADWVRVGIKGDGLMPDYKSFQMAKPSRLVVDLPKMTNAYPKKTVDVGSQFLKNIRIGQHPNKLRLVFTFPGAKIPPFQLAKEGQDLILLVGQTQAALPKEEKAPVAEAAKPVEVAEAAAKAEAQQPEVVAPPPAEKPAAEEKAPPTEVKPAPEAKPAGEVKAVEAEKIPMTMYKGAKISLDFKDADIHNIFRLIAEVSNLNVITTEDVKGRITIRLVNVPWDQALDVILASKHLIKIEEGNVLRITTVENVRKEMEDKAKEETNLLKSMENRENAEELFTETFQLNYGKAADLQKVFSGAAMGGAAGAVKPILSSRGSVRFDDRTNTMIVRDIRARLDEVQNLIKRLDSPTPQVLIEARVVQALTSFTQSLGIQWGGSYNQTDGGSWMWGLTGNNPSAAAGWGFTPSAAGGSASTPLIMPSNFIVNFPASTANTPVGGAAISFGKLTGNLVNLDLRLQMGETDSTTRVIARPKLATLDNKEANIKQGEKIPYETTSQAGTQVQFIDAVLSLTVTPHVTPDQSILMKVKVTRDARGTFRSPINQVPSIDNREASTEVLVKDGETLVIGGIYQSETDEIQQGIPYLMKIPVLGWLFKNRETIDTKTELLIFITPTIIHQAKAAS